MTTSTARITPVSTTSAGSSHAGASRGRAVAGETRQKETAQYIADMVLELRNLAKSDQLHHVMVPLEIAYYEAYGVANRVEVPPGEAERIRELSRASGDEVHPETR